MNTTELCAVLGVDRETVEQYVRDGMPEVTAGEYDETDVASWLVDSGNATVDSANIKSTPREAAAELDCTDATVRNWMQLAGFPGSAGYFPIDEIKQWRADRKQKKYESTIEGREQTARERIQELKLAAMQNEYIHVDTVADIVVHCHEAAAASLRRAKGVIESYMPTDIPSEVLHAFRKGFDLGLNEAMRDVEKSIMDWEEKKEELQQ